MQYQCCRERRSRYILRLARFLAQLGDFDQALQALNRVVTETQMAKANIELLRGDIFSQRGELESALETWKRVVELPVPSSPDAALTIAKATAYINLGDPGQAARLLDEIKSPEVALRGDYWLARAMSLFVANREPESVLSAAEHALQIFGRQNYLMRLIRAGALTRLGRSKGALADLNHLVAEVPRFAQCQTQLLRGHALIALDAFIDALAAFRTAEATAPDEFTRMCAEVGVGLAQVSLGRREEALPSLKAAALTSDDLPAGLPYRWLAWWALGTVYAGNGSNEQALAAFAHASAIEPRNADIQIAQGKIHARLEDFEAALRCFQVAFDSALEDGNRKEAFLGQGGALLKLERHEEAIAAYRSALGLASENGTVWQALGEAYAADGRHNAALQAFRRAYRLARSEPGKSLPSAPALGVSAQLLALEKNQEASQFLDQARYKVASDAKFDFNNGIALTRLRRYREAIEACRRAGDMQEPPIRLRR